MTQFSYSPNQRISLHTTAQPVTLGYRLTWRQRKLVVSLPSSQDTVIFLPLLNRDWLADCLTRSPVTAIKLDISLGEKQLKAWADASLQANKSVYLRLRQNVEAPHHKYPQQWLLKRMLDWITAMILLVLLSPIMVVLACLITISSPGPILFKQWRVGKRGQLFQIFKFRTMVVGAERLHHQVMHNQSGLHKLFDDPRITPLGRWMRKYSLDELPQLVNVLRGEMSLVGPRPWALYDAVRVRSDLQPRLNALPGITGAWQVQLRSHQRDLNLVNHNDLIYLRTWSLDQDLKLLLLTIPRVLSGFGAY